MEDKRNALFGSETFFLASCRLICYCDGERLHSFIHNLSLDSFFILLQLVCESAGVQEGEQQSKSHEIDSSSQEMIHQSFIKTAYDGHIEKLPNSSFLASFLTDGHSSQHKHTLLFLNVISHLTKHNLLHFIYSCSNLVKLHFTQTTQEERKCLFLLYSRSLSLVVKLFSSPVSLAPQSFILEQHNGSKIKFISSYTPSLHPFTHSPNHQNTQKRDCLEWCESKRAKKKRREVKKIVNEKLKQFLSEKVTFSILKALNKQNSKAKSIKLFHRHANAEDTGVEVRVNKQCGWDVVLHP